MPKLKTSYIFPALLFVFYAIILAKPINLTTQDIGRHIANGREIVSGNSAVLFQNFYSYTMPEAEFVNHHWLFGLIVFGIAQTLGFVGLHIFHILILLIAFRFLLKIIKQKTSYFYSLIFGLLAVLFLSLRTEVRPESIGLLFIAHTLLQIQYVIQNKRLTNKQIIALLIQQLLWINIHISFIFGLFLTGLLFSTSFLLHSPHLDKKTNQRLILLISGMTLVSLINPNFITGALQPFLIFTDYGYAIVENQTLLFLWRVIQLTTVFPFLLITAIGSILLILNRKALSWFEIILYMTGFILGFSALRNITIFVFFSLPILAQLCHTTMQKCQALSKIKLTHQHKQIILSQLYLFVIAVSLSNQLMPGMALSRRKLGLLPGQNQAAAFVKNENLTGPIFNNYDLGSYIIYHHPDIKVFTDNRPEAYNKDFFQKIYIPMQTDPEVWQEQQHKHQFHTIIFGIRDLTPAAHQFLQFISDHPDWQLLFQDEFVKIWTHQAE
jgi:hypothetical protein